MLIINNAIKHLPNEFDVNSSTHFTDCTFMTVKSFGRMTLLSQKYLNVIVTSTRPINWTN